MIRVPSCPISARVRRLLAVALLVAAVAAPVAAATSPGLLGVYYSDVNLLTVAAVHKGEGVAFAWNGGQPDVAVPGSNWSGRWQGTITPPVTGTWTIFVAADDGVRLKVDGQLLVDRWIAEGTTEYSGTIALTAGTAYPIVIEYYQGTGGSALTLSWQSAAVAKQVVPVSALALPSDTVVPGGSGAVTATHVTDRVATLAWTTPTDNLQIGLSTVLRDGTVVGRTGSASFTDTTVAANHSGYHYQVQTADAMGNTGPISATTTVSTPPAPTPGTGTGLAATYFNDPELGTAVATRTDPRIDLVWGLGAPLAAVTSPIYSVRWQGDIQALYSETYTFTAVVDSDARLVIGGQTLIDAWNWGTSAGPLPMPRTVTASIAMTAGQRVPIRLDYARHYGSAEAHLYWQSLSQPKVIVPSAQLYPAAPADPLADPLVGGASATSPAWLEGVLGSPTSTVTVAIAGQSPTVVKESATRWYATSLTAGPPGIALTPGAPLTAVVTTSDGHGHQGQQTATLSWTVTTLAGAGAPLTVRVGDKLLVTATKAGGGGTSLAIDPAYDGTTFHAQYSGTPGTGIVVPFAAAGAATIAAQVDGVLVGTRAVTAVAVDFQGPVADQVTYTRAKSVLVTPATAAAAVAFTAVSPDRLTVSTTATTSTGATLALRALYLAPDGVQARLGGANGPLVAQQPIDAFLISTTASTGMDYVQTFSDGSIMAQAVMSMKPLVPNLSVVISCIVSGVTFDDSTTSRTVPSAGFTASGDHGSYTYRLVLGAGVNSHLCHNTTVYQNGVRVSN